MVVGAVVALDTVVVAARGTRPVAGPDPSRTHITTRTPSPAGPRPLRPSPLGPSPLESLVPTDAAGLAAQLAATETAIRDPATPPGALSRLGQLEQLDYGSLSAHPGWDAPVLAHLPARLRLPASMIVDAGRQLDALDAGTPPSNVLPPWHIVAPLPANTLLDYYQSAAKATGIPWSFFAAINLVETRMGRIRGDSPAGAQGPMQFMPSTWEIYGAGGDINSPHDAVTAAARLLRANGGPADMNRALYHYNASDQYVQAVTDYAKVMAADRRAFLGFYHWQVFVTTLHGEILLPVGYPQPRDLPAALPALVR